MKEVTRIATTGSKKEGTYREQPYKLMEPENVGEFLSLLQTSPETKEVTINLSALITMSNLAMKSWHIIQDNANRPTSEGVKKGKNNRLSALGL